MQRVTLEEVRRIANLKGWKPSKSLLNSVEDMAIVRSFITDKITGERFKRSKVRKCLDNLSNQDLYFLYKMNNDQVRSFFAGIFNVVPRSIRRERDELIKEADKRKKLEQKKEKAWIDSGCQMDLFGSAANA